MEPLQTAAEIWAEHESLVGRCVLVHGIPRKVLKQYKDPTAKSILFLFAPTKHLEKDVTYSEWHRENVFLVRIDFNAGHQPLSIEVLLLS
jgi:hypothetical protein